MKKTKNHKKLKKLAVAILITLLAASLYTAVAGHTKAAKDRAKLEQTTIQLNVSKSKLQAEIKAHGVESEQQKKDIEELNRQLQDAKTQLEAKRNTPKVYAAGLSISDADAKMYIYMHESGNNPNSVNSIGCRGLGQACPGTKLPCGADYACQDAWFTNYMLQRYGSWQNAYVFWINNHWW